MYDFFRTLVLNFFYAKNYPGTLSTKISIYTTLNRLFIKSLLKKNEKGIITEQILGFKISAFNYEQLRLLFEEMFITEQYRFTSPNQNPLIIDCGANIGIASLYFKLKYPNCSVIAYEPDPDSYQLLVKNIKQNDLKNITTKNVGLAEKEGTITFYTGDVKGDLTSSIVKGRSSGAQSFKIKTEQLSSVLKANKCDLIKMDIEGAESEVIKDLEENNALHLCPNYIVEYHHGISGTKPALSKFLSRFERNDFNYSLGAIHREIGKTQDILVNASNK